MQKDVQDKIKKSSVHLSVLYKWNCLSRYQEQNLSKPQSLDFLLLLHVDTKNSVTTPVASWFSLLVFRLEFCQPPLCWWHNWSCFFSLSTPAIIRAFSLSTWWHGQSHFPSATRTAWAPHQTVLQGVHGLWLVIWGSWSTARGILSEVKCIYFYTIIGNRWVRNNR